MRTLPSLKSVYIDPALYHVLVRIPGYFCGAIISKNATVHMASAHTTAQEYVGHLTRHDPFGCDQKHFYTFIAYLVHHIYCIHCGYHCKRKVLIRCLYHYSQEHMVVYSLATAKRVHTSGGKL